MVASTTDTVYAFRLTYVSTTYRQAVVRVRVRAKTKRAAYLAAVARCLPGRGPAQHRVPR